MTSTKTIGFLYSLWYTCTPNMRSVEASLLEISYLWGYHNLIPNYFWPPPKTIGSCTHYGTPIPNMRSVQASLLEISCLQAQVRTSPVLTPHDLWPPPKTIGFLYSMWYAYIPNIISVQASLLEISCLQDFHNLTPVDPKWPRPPPKTIGFLYSMWYAYIPNIISVQASHLEISCLQGFHNLTPVDPKWPLTSTKNNRVLVLNVVRLHPKYNICPSFPSWDIVFTRFSQFDPCWPQMTFDLHQKQ